MEEATIPNVDEATANANSLFAWLEQQPEGQSDELAEALFSRLLERSAKSRVSSVNACTKLCGFVQHCAKLRTKAPVRAWVFRESTTLRLFRFYIEWNETDQHRSMKLVLDLVALLIVENPQPETQAVLRAHILQTLISILAHKSIRPLVKSAISSLNHLLSKKVYAFEDVARVYGDETGSASTPDSTNPNLAVWQGFVQDMFAWMTLHYVCPVAGKLLVAVFTFLQTSAVSGSNDAFASFTVDLWLQWLQNGLSTHPGILEDVKLYFFIPLFKTDRASSLKLLESLNASQSATHVKSGISSDTSNVDNAAILQLAALEVGKKAGLVDDPGLNLTGKPPRGIVLNEDLLHDVLTCASNNVRSLALSLLVSSQSTTKPFSTTAFSLLRKVLPGYHAESDPKFRYELLSHTRDMGVRLKSAITVMRRRLQQENSHLGVKAKAKVDLIDNDLVKEALDNHEAFLTWYLTFLRSELAPTASYQRHFTSLKATSWLLRLRRDVSGGSSDTLDLTLSNRLFRDQTWIRCVLDLIMDPFEDVRETATSLLALAPRDIVSASTSATVPYASFSPSRFSLWDALAEFSRRADILASRTARADHADGAARCQGLLCSWANDLSIQMSILSRVLDVLETKISMAQFDLGTAAVKSPVHGEFASIRYIWDGLVRSKYSEEQLGDLAKSQLRIVRNCQSIWDIVKHVLCDDSPEGHLPEEMEEAVGLDSKDLLSYSFRSINESSITMRSIVSPLRFSRVKDTLIPDKTVFEAIGSLAFQQLSSLRHRGALTTVAQTFTLCCQMARDPLVTDPETPDEETLIMVWYKGTLGCIRSQVSTTRRSAGIPGLFSGILASNAAKPSFEEAMRTACQIAQEPARVHETDGSRLPQVHALNCLRDVFRSSFLSKRAERQLPECLQLAAASLRSEVWAIRNCGLLLLRSLIDSLFGTGESKADLESGWDGRTIRVSYNKYSTLPGVLLGLLQSEPIMDGRAAKGGAADHLEIELQQAAAESVFPALDILRRAGPPDTHREELYRAVVQYLGSHLWHVREMAARTVCSFLIVQDWDAGIQSLLLDERLMSANRLHGTLLTVRFILGRVSETSRHTIPDKLPQLLSLLDGLAEKNSLVSSCQEVEAAYLEARNTMSNLALSFGIVLEYRSDTETRLEHLSSTTSALLRIQRAIQENYSILSRNARGSLRDLLARTSVSDPDTTTILLDVIPQSWFTGSKKNPDTAAWLSDIYVDVCLPPAVAPVARAAALLQLTDVLDYLLLGGHNSLLPDTSRLASLWAAVSNGAINPTLSCAIIRSSGPIIAATIIAQRAESLSSWACSVTSWTAMIAFAGGDDQTFDSRMAAVEALRSFALAGEDQSFFDGEPTSSTPPVLSERELLSFASCVYDSLNDDDDEIRDVAATAAGAVLGTGFIPGEAARQFPEWMATRLGHLADFGMLAACRMEGRQQGPTAVAVAAWPRADVLLARALQFDDALFVVEEQNLFVDEVREAERWGEVIQVCIDKGETITSDLVNWLSDGLQALVERVRSDGGDDGPLGWTATPGVFAVCARLLIGSRAVAIGNPGTEGVNKLVHLLDEFRKAGEAARVHGLLLAVAKA